MIFAICAVKDFELGFGLSLPCRLELFRLVKARCEVLRLLEVCQDRAAERFKASRYLVGSAKSGLHGSGNVSLKKGFLRFWPTELESSAKVPSNVFRA